MDWTTLDSQLGLRGRAAAFLRRRSAIGLPWGDCGDSGGGITDRFRWLRLLCHIRTTWGR